MEIVHEAGFMNDQLAITTAQLAEIIITILVFSTIACLRRHPRLDGFWTGMFRQWRAAAILTLFYLISLGISLTGLEADLPHIVISTVASGGYMFCLIMLGLGLTAKIAGFEPFQLRRGVKAISGILIGVLILLVLAGLINMPIGQGLIALGITGPPEVASGLEFFQGLLTFQVFFMLLTGAGIAEEVFYRLLVMSGLWWLLKRPSLAILISAILFGLYHLSPLNNLYLSFWDYPVYQFITTFLFGLAAAWVYQRWGLEAAILGHTLGNSTGVVIMKFGL